MIDLETLADLRSDSAQREGQFAMQKVRLYANNSGGYDWLDFSDWINLQRGGWTVTWSDGRLPQEAVIATDNVDTARMEFANALDGKFTGLEQGCPCCGEPFQFDTIDWEED